MEQEQFISWTTLLPSHDGNLLLSTREPIVLGCIGFEYDCTQICFLLSTTSFVRPWLLKSVCCPKMNLHMDTGNFRFSSGCSEPGNERCSQHAPMAIIEWTELRYSSTSSVEWSGWCDYRRQQSPSRRRRWMRSRKLVECMNFVTLEPSTWAKDISSK